MAHPMKSLYNETNDFPAGLILFSFQCNITSTNTMTFIFEKRKEFVKYWQNFGERETFPILGIDTFQRVNNVKSIKLNLEPIIQK